MIIRENKTFETNSLFPNSDWYGEGNYIIDETTEQGRQLAQTFMNNFPFVDILLENEIVIDVVVLEKPIKPPEVVGKTIKLVENEEGAWVYIYVDKELTELEKLQKELAEQKALMNALLGVTE